MNPCDPIVTKWQTHYDNVTADGNERWADAAQLRLEVAETCQKATQPLVDAAVELALFVDSLTLTPAKQPMADRIAYLTRTILDVTADA